MSLVFLNGFEDQQHCANPTGGGPSTGFETTLGRTGTTSLRCNTSGTVNSQALQLPIPGGGDATVIVGQALYCLTNGTNVIATFCSDNGSTYHVSVTFTLSTGVLTVKRGDSNGTTLGSATLSGAALNTSTWGYWEVKCTLSDTVGQVTVRYNESVVLDLTGQDTKNAGTKTVIDTVQYAEGFNGQNVWSDDFYVVTGTGSPSGFLGDCRVQTVYPTGNGDFSQLVNDGGNSTNNYSRVNETGAAVTTSYVESGTTGQRDFYQMGDIQATPQLDIYGVQVRAIAENPDGGSVRAAKLGVRQGSSEALSSAQPLTGASYIPVSAVFTVDPATGAAWTNSGVNSMQAGLEVA